MKAAKRKPSAGPSAKIISLADRRAAKQAEAAFEKEQDRVNACETEVRRLRDSAEQARTYATQSLQQIIAAAPRVAG